MAERIIRKLGDPVLRQICKPVTNITNIVKLLDDMAETLQATPNGAALAAPQVGIPKRLVVVDDGESILELINPEIVKRSGKQTGPEACLSLPGVWGEVERADFVAVKAQARTGETFVIEAEAYMARCLQHEIDHLDGVLFIDHVAPGRMFNNSDEPVDVRELLRISRQRIE